MEKVIFKRASLSAAVVAALLAPAWHPRLKT